MVYVSPRPRRRSRRSPIASPSCTPAASSRRGRPPPCSRARATPTPAGCVGVDPGPRRSASACTASPASRSASTTRPPGCPFVPRCEQASRALSRALPPLEDLGDDRAVRCFEALRTPPLGRLEIVATRPERRREPLLGSRGCRRFIRGRGATVMLPRHLLRVGPRALRRAGRRVGQRQDDDRPAVVGLHPPRGRHDHARRRAARGTAPRSARASSAGASRSSSRTRTSRSTRGSGSATRSRGPPASSAGSRARGRPAGVASCSSGSGCRRASPAGSRRALRRRAPARRDRPRARGRPRSADLRRDHLGARRVGPGGRVGLLTSCATSSGSRCCSSPTTSASSRAIADDVLILADGLICERGSVERVFGSPQHPRTRELLEAAPRPVVPDHAEAS